MNIFVTGDAGFLSSVLPRREAMLPEPASIWYTRSIPTTVIANVHAVF